jgi:hypothetical protein
MVARGVYDTRRFLMKIFNNIFESKLLHEIIDYYNEIKVDHTGEPAHFWTNDGWPEGIVKDSGVVLCTDVRDTFGQKIFETCYHNQVFYDEEGNDLGHPSDSAIMLYSWKRYSYIPFHSDGHCDIGATLFLNPEWEKDWGGAQIYYDKDRYVLEYPEFNKMCVHYDDSPHSTTMVHPAAPDRLTLQLFFTFDE